MSKVLTGLAAIAVLASVAGCGGVTNQTANNTGTTTDNNVGAAKTNATTMLNETGSSLLYPLFNGEWIQAYEAKQPNVKLSAASTGSGTGISQAIAGTVQIGASDAYLANAQMASSPSMLNIPLAVSAQQIMYNLPGLKKNTHLKLTGDVLAQIYMGQVKYWNDAKIKSLNPGVALPSKPILTIHRSDGSGDTFLFTQFLSKTNSTWSNKYGYGTALSWPAVAGSIGQKGNDGIVTALANNPYSISYVGISWLDRATQQGLGYAALKNHDGNFELPQASNIQAAANAMVNKVPNDERVSLIYAPGKISYPIVNFEYAIVNSKQPSPQLASALTAFLNWATDPNGGNSSRYLKPVHFLPLPSSVAPKSLKQIAKITG